MENRKPFMLQPKVDYVTVLIIVFFLALTIGVFVYFKHRIEAINSELKQGSSAIPYVERKAPGSYFSKTI